MVACKRILLAGHSFVNLNIDVHVTAEFTISSVAIICPIKKTTPMENYANDHFYTRYPFRIPVNSQSISNNSCVRLYQYLFPFTR